MIIVDHVHFIMPRNKEYLFAAMAVVQHYVNTFDDKMKVNNTTLQEGVIFQLKYYLDIRKCDWDLFVRAGLLLAQQPELTRLQAIDAVFDFSDERVESFLNHCTLGAEKHLVEIYGALCGVQTLVVPRLRQVAPKTILDGGYRWMWLAGCFELAQTFTFEVGGKSRQFDCFPDSYYLLDLKDKEITGVIGYASHWTYLSASMGIPTIEIIPKDRQRRWLSKFANKAYRIVRNDDTMVEQITSAIINLEGLTLYIEQKRAADVQEGKASNVQLIQP